MTFLQFVLLVCTSVLSLSVCLALGNDDTDHRIIGGRPALEGEFPFIVSIRRSYNDKHFCGGTIVSKKYILTAAHCMHYTWGGVLPPIVVSVVAGQNTLTMEPATIFRNASKVVVHEKFGAQTYLNDIAVIELSEELPVDVNKFISTIGVQQKTLESGQCTVVGWGVHEFKNDTTSEDLYTVDVDIVKHTECAKKYKDIFSLPDTMMCAGVSDGSKDACQGDSGGPLICNGLLTGIVSTGKGCGSPLYPGLYTEVAEYQTWIQNHTDLIMSDEKPPNKPDIKRIIQDWFSNFFHVKQASAASQSGLSFYTTIFCVSFLSVFNLW